MMPASQAYTPPRGERFTMNNVKGAIYSDTEPLGDIPGGDLEYIALGGVVNTRTWGELYLYRVTLGAFERIGGVLYRSPRTGALYTFVRGDASCPGLVRHGGGVSL